MVTYLCFKTRYSLHIFLSQDHMLVHVHYSHNDDISQALDWAPQVCSHNHMPHRTVLYSLVGSHNAQQGLLQIQSPQQLLSA